MEYMRRWWWFPKPLTGGSADAAVLSALGGSKPAMIARFGSTEIKAVLFPFLPRLIQEAVRQRVVNRMQIFSGFFPPSEPAVRRFSEMMLADMQDLDVLGSWRIEERFFCRRFAHATLVELSALEPYLSASPWSSTLKDKRVLVVHPFVSTIRRQYEEKRHLLFADNRVLPPFASLELVAAVQTIAGAESRFKDWFAALESMKTEISSKDFDVAIIGCGAYGFPLAAHVKRLGKQAVHLGGATQLLFGIRGNRWEKVPSIASLFNEHWVRPDAIEKPTGAEKIEGACYW
jgi:hypothetical protein